jgi:hypothetical protein
VVERPKKLDDETSRAFEHHGRRSRALHDVLDADPLWTVRDWDKTDDEIPQDEVELWLELKEGAANVAPLETPALVYVAKILIDAGLSTAVAEGVKYLLAKCRKKQEAEQIGDVSIWFPDETTARVGCWPAGNVWIALSSLVTVPYNAAYSQVSGLGPRATEAINVPTSLLPFVREMIRSHQRRAE